jgi:hypothetical protein
VNAVGVALCENPQHATKKRTAQSPMLFKKLPYFGTPKRLFPIKWIQLLAELREKGLSELTTLDDVEVRAV